MANFVNRDISRFLANVKVNLCKSILYFDNFVVRVYNVVVRKVHVRYDAISSPGEFLV